MIKIYTQDLDGKHLIATVDQINQVEAYRECCRNIVTTEDVDMSDIVRDLPEPESLEDDALCISYGVDPRKLESALIVGGCIVIVPILLVIGYFMQ